MTPAETGEGVGWHVDNGNGSSSGMWITSEVNLPSELLAAHEAGKLVLFVGAGASMGDPSNLPSFKELARQLAMAAQVPFDDEMALDLFLGSMPADFDTHAHAQRIVAPSESTFNPTHTALVRLASAQGATRIVTTNFDDHLYSASTSALLPEGDVWVGPALPLGDDFTGIVHLHGSVLRPPEQLVLTDRDFGRAYLIGAWATRFLQAMFDQFVVLFVGYSHDDPIMRYLALGLPSKTHRYVLTSSPEDDKWKHLGIVPVQYPAVANDHSALLAMLKAWDRQARMGRLDHQTRMREIVEAEPPLDPVDEDYLRRRLQDVSGAREFAQHARGVNWLAWLEDIGIFSSLFAGGRDTEVSSVLSNWFSQVYVADPRLHGAALHVIQRLGSRLSMGLYQSLSYAAQQLLGASSDAGRRWTIFLATSVEGVSAPPNLEMLLPDDSDTVVQDLALVRVSLRPFLRLKPQWLATSTDPASPPGAEVTWHANGEVLTRHLLKLVEDRPAGDPELGALLEDALGTAYELLAGYHGSGYFDGLSYRRSAIEPHPQDDLGEAVDTLIDGLRGYGAKALVEHPELPGRWWRRGPALFRRLGLHLIEVSSTMSSDEKLRWVLDREVLFEVSLKHEVFRLLADAVPQASTRERSRLLTAVLEGPDVPEEIPETKGHSAYTVYNLLVWLTQSDPSWAEAEREFERIQTEHPTFAPREYPDLDSWMSGVFIRGEVLPMEVDDFIQDLDTNAEGALNRVLAIDYSESRFDGPNWDSALTLVRQVAARRPDVSQRLWHAALGRPTLTDKREDLQEALIGGWEGADLGESFDTVMGLVANGVGVPRLTRAIARFLVTQIENHLDTPEFGPIAAARDVALRLWEARKGSFVCRPDSEPSFLALNSWPGDLARYWVLEVNRRWREVGEEWKGMNAVERQAFDALLAGPDSELDAIRPALGGQAHFLFSADAEFARQRVLPLFDCPHAEQAWDAYLFNPRYSERMLGAGFLPSVIAQWDRLGNLGTRVPRHQFYRLVLSILNLSSIERVDRHALLSRSVLAQSGSYAAEFARAAVEFIKAETVDGAITWELWARDHIKARLDGLPRIASAAELEQWADLAPLVGGYADEAFSMLAGRGIGLGKWYRVPEWSVELLTEKGPVLVCHLAERITNTNPEGRIAYVVNAMISGLVGALGEVVCEPLVDGAVEAGVMLSDPRSG